MEIATPLQVVDCIESAYAYSAGNHIGIKVEVNKDTYLSIAYEAGLGNEAASTPGMEFNGHILNIKPGPAVRVIIMPLFMQGGAP